jgi:hypothetical protein
VNRTTAARLSAFASLAVAALALTGCKTGSESGTMPTSTGTTYGSAPYTEWKPIGTTTAANAPAPMQKAAPAPAPAPAKK